MAPGVAEVMETVRTLPRDQVADLAYQVLLMLDDDGFDDDGPAVDRAWNAELQRRVDEIENGDVKLVSHEETVALAREMLAARH